MDRMPCRRCYGPAVAILLLIMLACNFPLPTAEPEQPIDVGPPAVEATPTPVAVALEPIIVTHVEPEFRLYSLEGVLQETRSAEGLDWARPNTAQVVGNDIYYVSFQGPDQGAVVRRVAPGGSTELEFTRSSDGGNLAFAVSPDGLHIAWSITEWGGTEPVSRLWLADIRGGEPTLVAETDTGDAIEAWFVLEPVEWLDGGDLVYAWQVTGIGGYILFFGWSSLYRYSPESGTTVAIAPVQEEVGAPCWNDVTFDGTLAVGACGPSADVIELDTTSGLETQFPVLPDQGQAGAGAYSSSGTTLAYAIARGDPLNEAGQVLVRVAPAEAPAAVASLTPGYFERLLWIDEQRLAAGTVDQEAAKVEVVTLDGARSPVGDGRLVGIMRQAVPALSGPCIEEQAARGDLVVKEITSKGELVGPGMTVIVHNPGTEDVDTCIPCGTVFTPSTEDAQELMAVQMTRGTVPAGGDATLTAFVTCIEADRGVPDDGAAYTFGSPAGGKLETFAQCVCQEDLAASQNPVDPMAILFAGWMISEGKSFSELREAEGQGALGEALGSEAGEALSGVLEVIEGPAKDRLQQCGLEP